MIDLKKPSAGILLYRKEKDKLKVFLAHPGGPFWSDKEEKAWDFPKGEVDDGEEIFYAALREIKEETGVDLSKRKREEFIDLGDVKRKDGKEIFIWALEEKGEWSGLLMGNSYVEMEYHGKKI